MTGSNRSVFLFRICTDFLFRIGLVLRFRVVEISALCPGSTVQTSSHALFALRLEDLRKSRAKYSRCLKAWTLFSVLFFASPRSSLNSKVAVFDTVSSQVLSQSLPRAEGTPGCPASLTGSQIAWPPVNELEHDLSCSAPGFRHRLFTSAISPKMTVKMQKLTCNSHLRSLRSNYPCPRLV